MEHPVHNSTYSLLQRLQWQWDLQLGAPWTNERGRCQIRKLDSDLANPKMTQIIALICQIFSPQSQLIWLSFKLPIKSLLLGLHSFTTSPIPPPSLVRFCAPPHPHVPLIPKVDPCSRGSLWGAAFPPTSCPALSFLRVPPKATPLLWPHLSSPLKSSLYYTLALSLPCLLLLLIIRTHLISSTRPWAPWGQAQNYLGINEKILEIEEYIGMNVWVTTYRFKVIALKRRKGRNGSSPSIFNDGILYTDQHCFCEFPITDFWGPLLEISDLTGLKSLYLPQLPEDSNVSGSGPRRETYHLWTENKLGYWTSSHLEDQAKWCSRMACRA